MDPFFEKFIEDIVKGANDSFTGGKRVSGERLNVQVNRDQGMKTANHAGLTAGLGSLAGSMHPGLAGMLATPVAAAAGAEDGSRLQAAGGALAGELGGSTVGGLAGGGLAHLLGMDPALFRQIGQMAGGAGGAAFGAHQMGEDRRNILQRAGDKLSAVEERYVAGVKDAADRFGIKEAFLGPLLGSVAGPALARAGVGALARGGGALSGMASKMLPRIGGGMGGMAFDAASSMAGGAVGNRLQGPSG